MGMGCKAQPGCNRGMTHTGLYGLLGSRDLFAAGVWASGRGSAGNRPAG
jgi:hypothetical protein